MVTAIIPVRGGSRRLKDKNILPFGDSNLLVHKIRQLKQVPGIDEVLVFSDSDVMLDMAKEEGVMFKKTPWEMDEVHKTFREVVRHMCENAPGDDIVWAQCTLPLIVPKQYEEALALYNQHKDTYDCLVAVEPFKKYLWDDQGPVNYRPDAHVPSQNLPQMYFVFGASLAPREKMIEWSHHIGRNPYKWALPKISCIDIDDELDMEVARVWYKVMHRYL